jgi:hypothetical protein
MHAFFAIKIFLLVPNFIDLLKLTLDFNHIIRNETELFEIILTYYVGSP